MPHIKPVCIFLLSVLLSSQASGHADAVDPARLKELREQLLAASDRVDTVLLPWCAVIADLLPNISMAIPDKRPAINTVLPGSDAEAAGLSKGDEVISIGNMATAGQAGMDFWNNVFRPALAQAASSGIPLPVVVKKSQPQESLVTVNFYPRLQCRGHVFVQGQSWARRYENYVDLSLDRLQNFTTDELTALVAWNKAAYALRLDYAPDANTLKKIEKGHAVVNAFVSSAANPTSHQDPMFKMAYNDSDLRRADLVALLVLRALDIDAGVYRSMLTKVSNWEQAHDAFYKVGTRREGFFDNYGNLPKLDANRNAFLDGLVKEAYGSDFIAYANKMEFKRLVTLQAMFDPGLRGVSTTMPLEAALSRYLPADSIKPVLDKYAAGTEARLVVANHRKHQIVLASGNGVETQLAAECGAAADACTLLTVNDYTFKRAAPATAADADYGFAEIKAPPPPQPLF